MAALIKCTKCGQFSPEHYEPMECPSCWEFGYWERDQDENEAYYIELDHRSHPHTIEQEAVNEWIDLHNPARFQKDRYEKIGEGIFRIYTKEKA